MLTRREVSDELRRIGTKELSLIKEYLEDYERYFEINYGLRIASTRAESEELLRLRVFFG